MSLSRMYEAGPAQDESSKSLLHETEGFIPLATRRRPFGLFAVFVACVATSFAAGLVLGRSQAASSTAVAWAELFPPCT